MGKTPNKKLKIHKNDFEQPSVIDNHHIIHHFSDSILINRKREITVKGLGELFAKINSFFLDYLKEYQLPIAFVKTHNKNSLRYLKHDKLKFYVKIINICDKKTAKIFGMKEHDALKYPLIEYYYTNGQDSLITESHLITFNLSNQENIKIINRMCSKVNAILKSYFERRNSTLAEVKCFFGKTGSNIYLVDDFTPNSLKVLPGNKKNNSANPYDLTSSKSIKAYTEFLHNQLLT